MGLQLPGALTQFLHIIGYNWPESDETKLFQMGQKWMKASGDLKHVLEDAQKGANQVWSENKGDDIMKFAEHWKHSEGPAKVLEGASTASTLLGTGMTVVSAIVLALKIQMIVQLTTLAIQTAQAIAAAVPTFGASLAEIPIFQQICKRLVGMVIDQVIGQLLNA